MTSIYKLRLLLTVKENIVRAEKDSQTGNRRFSFIRLIMYVLFIT